MCNVVNECHSWVYEPRESKIGTSKDIVGECKYIYIFSLMSSSGIWIMTTHKIYNFFVFSFFKHSFFETV